jgi:hypothetical protein
VVARGARNSAPEKQALVQVLALHYGVEGAAEASHGAYRHRIEMGRNRPLVQSRMKASSECSSSCVPLCCLQVGQV